MREKIIYHICTVSEWKDQNNSEYYMHKSIENEGFIHCSFKHQIKGVMERYFEDQKDLLLLIIDSDKITHELKIEKAPIGDSFPHIYGPLNKSAILEIKEWVE